MTTISSRSSSGAPSSGSPPSGAPSPSSPASAVPSSTPSEAEVRGLESALRAEQAAVYAYGVVGARADADSRKRARAQLTAHAGRRDLLAARLSAVGRRPPAADPAYALPFDVDSAETARALAAHVESGLAAGYADLVAAVGVGRRVEAATWLRETAVDARRWGAADVPFPGLPERAPTP